jgi:outer membrane protein
MSKSTIAATVLMLAAAPPLGAQQPADSTVTMTLREAVRIALDHAIAVRTSELDVTAAEAGARASRAAFEPLLSLNPNVAGSDGRAGTPAGTGVSQGGSREFSGALVGLLPTSTRYALSLDSRGTLQDPVTTQAQRTEYSNTLNITLTQPLLQGLGRTAGLDQRHAAEIAVRSVRFRRARQVEALLASVEATYFQFSQREAEERAMAESLARAEELLQRNLELFGLSRVTELDVLTSRAGVAQRRSSLINARRQRLNAADQLIALIYGADAAPRLAAMAPYLATRPVPVDVSVVEAVDAAMERAIRQRADVRAAHEDVARWDVFLRIQENGVLPALGLSASWTALGSGMGEPLRFGVGGPGSFASTGWSAGLAFSYAIGNSRARASLAESRAVARQASWLLAQVENATRVDVRAGHRGVGFGAEAMAEATASLQLARSLYEGEAERHRLGLTDAFRLLQVEESVTQAVLAEVAARYALLSAITQYKLGVGGLLLEEYGAAAVLPVY